MDAKRNDQEDDEGEAFFRSITWAEEDRHKFTSAPWRGEYRWFRSPNVACIENYVKVARKKRERTFATKNRTISEASNLLQNFS